MAPQLIGKDQLGEIGHSHGVENTVQVIALVLDDPGMKPCRLAIEGLAVWQKSLVANMPAAWHGAGQTGNRETPFPTEILFIVQHLDLGIDQGRKGGEVGLFR